MFEKKIVSAEQRGLNLLCAMLRRFDTPAAKVKQQIEAGELGTLLNINQVIASN